MLPAHGPGSDHVHFNFAGNYRVASGLADQVVSLLPEPLRPAAGSRRKVLSEEECAERLAFTDWDKRLVLERMWRRAQEPPFTEQLGHEKLIERWSGLLSDLARKTTVPGPRQRSPTMSKRMGAGLETGDRQLTRKSRDTIVTPLRAP